MTHVLAIDQGTSGTKAVVVSDDAVLGLAEVPVRPAYLDGGAVEQDPGELLDSVLLAGRQAVAAAGVPIDVVTLANQGESVLAWDPRTGDPLTAVVVWQDGRAQEVCDDLADHAELVAARTGLVLDPYFSAPKQAWVRRHLTRDGVVTTTDAWLVHHLTGELVTDVSTASRSLVTDLSTGEWDGELLELFGLADERMPRILANDEMAGTTAAFGGDVPVGGLVVDQQAALLAQRCLAPGEAKCTFGTGAFLLANVGARAAALERRSHDVGGLAGAAGTRRTASTGRSSRPPRRCGGCRTSDWSPRPRSSMRWRRTTPAACSRSRPSPASGHRGGVPTRRRRSPA